MPRKRRTKYKHPILSPAEARWTCDPSVFDFETTEALESPEAFLGQKRALRALSFGADAGSPGFNVFVSGMNGTGRTSMTENFLQELAAVREAPEDYCYVYNFEEESRPRQLGLPAGMGVALRNGMDDLVKELARSLPKAFEEEDYERERMALKMTVERHQAEAFEELRAAAEEHGFAIARTQQGFAVAPVKDGQVLEPAQMAEMEEEEQEALKAGETEVRNLLRLTLRKFRDIEKEATKSLEKQERDNAESVVAHALYNLRKQFRGQKRVRAFLDQVQEDILDNIEEFKASDEEQNELQMVGPGASETAFPFSYRYKVNLLVNHAEQEGVPVVREAYPTYRNLLGSADHQSYYGNLVSHFTMIRPGSMHRANGGFLVIDAEDLLSSPQAWEGFKRALKVKELNLEEPFDQFKTTSTVAMRPEPIPLRLKVVMIGTPLIFHLLSTNDSDFPELFKVPAEFRASMNRSPRSIEAFAGFCAARCKDLELRPLTPAAVARLAEHSSRRAGQRDRLDLRFRDLIDLISEADYWACKEDQDDDGSSVIDRDDVEVAINNRDDRGMHLQENVLRMIREGTIRMDLGEARVGQIHGLTVLQAGQRPFGLPARVSARITAGQGFVVNVEREVQLSGPFHNKGVLILTGYLKGRYGLNHPLSVNASIVFEQSYSPVDGDSATLAELCCVLSGISEVPMRQDIAITGSLDQMGRVQAVGGLNEKIEGFWAACQELDPERDVGVILPATNVRHLMLSQEVTEAVASKQLSIWPVETVEDALEILTGITAEQMDQLVEDRLQLLRENVRGMGGGGESVVLMRDHQELPAGPPDPGPKK